MLRSSPAITSDLEGLILRNAHRLLDDAKALDADGRHASALALSILAIEEVGKVVMRQWSADPTFRHDRKHYGFHKVKQAVAAALLTAKESYEAIMENFEPHGFVMLHRSQMAEHQREFAAKVNMMTTPAFREHLAKRLHDGTATMMQRAAYSGTLARISQMTWNFLARIGRNIT